MIITVTAQPTINVVGTEYTTLLMNNYISRFVSQAKSTGVVNYRVQPGDNILQSTIDTLQATSIDILVNDVPLTSTQYPSIVNENGPILHLPIILTAVNIIHNIPATGFSCPTNSCNLNITLSIITKILKGQITHWNDNEIVQDNPYLTYTGAISTVVRGDTSSTNYDLVHALLARGILWPYSLPGQTIPWSTFTQTATTTITYSEADLIQAVLSTPGSFSYGHRRTARQNNVSSCAVQNTAGNFIYPTPESLLSATTSFSKNILDFTKDYSQVVLANEIDSNAYTFTAFIYMIVYLNQIQISTNLDRAILNAEFCHFVMNNPQYATGYVAQNQVILNLNKLTIDGMLSKAINTINIDISERKEFHDILIATLAFVCLIILAFGGTSIAQNINKCRHQQKYSKINGRINDIPIALNKEISKVATLEALEISQN